MASWQSSAPPQTAATLLPMSGNCTVPGIAPSLPSTAGTLTLDLSAMYQVQQQQPHSQHPYGLGVPMTAPIMPQPGFAGNGNNGAGAIMHRANLQHNFVPIRSISSANMMLSTSGMPSPMVLSRMDDHYRPSSEKPEHVDFAAYPPSVVPLQYATNATSQQTFAPYSSQPDSLLAFSSATHSPLPLLLAPCTPTMPLSGAHAHSQTIPDPPYSAFGFF
ncbi:hypothetical protein GGI25_004210 [Coemansia spiralis]|uniref:Uncharacterized protein n=1 Tax=Coemansia spiralis TaxID=417178 RepID=A0A9W8G4L8_9FUNG|nr:hypothetical protein GGI25_004210 [Coemansia spiralis]